MKSFCFNDEKSVNFFSGKRGPIILTLKLLKFPFIYRSELYKMRVILIEGIFTYESKRIETICSNLNMAEF